jgi:hypothetical protein
MKELEKFPPGKHPAFHVPGSEGFKCECSYPHSLFFQRIYQYSGNIRNGCCRKNFLPGNKRFFVTDGYESFQEEAADKGILPLFNIEFIALLREEQKAGIRINDPNNPGTVLFCGKGLDYPFHLESTLKAKLEKNHRTQPGTGEIDDW